MSSHQCRTTPATIKQLVMMYVSTIAVRIQAIWLASLSVLPDFSPSALAQSLHMVKVVFAKLHVSPKLHWDCPCQSLALAI
jgi:hypothetical protein